MLLACLMILTTPMSVLAEESGFLATEDAEILDADANGSDAIQGADTDGTEQSGLEITGIETVASSEETLRFTEDLAETEVAYVQGEEAQPLKVMVQGDEITYQWLRSEDGAQFTAIEDATEPEYFPSTDEVGTVWYQAEATSADGELVTSHVIRITVAEVPGEAAETEEMSEAEETEPMSELEEIAETEAQSETEAATETEAAAEETETESLIAELNAEENDAMLLADDTVTRPEPITKEQIQISDDLDPSGTYKALTETGLTVNRRENECFPQQLTIYKTEIDKSARNLTLAVTGRTNIKLADVTYASVDALKTYDPDHDTAFKNNYVVSDGSEAGQQQLANLFGEAVFTQLKARNNRVFYIEYVERNSVSKKNYGVGSGVLIEEVPHISDADEVAQQPDIKSDTVGNTHKTFELPQTGTVTFTVALKDDKVAQNKQAMGTLTYEWYRNTENSYDGAEKLQDGIDGTFAITSQIAANGRIKNFNSKWTTKATSKLGTTWYFCKVTNTLSNGSSVSYYSKIGSVTVTGPEEPVFGIITGEDPVGSISISAEDMVPERSDLKDGAGNVFQDPGPVGSILNTSLLVYPSDTMTTVIKRACLLNDVQIGIRGTGGMGSYIYQIGAREEFDRGRDSGWMGSLNGWYTNTGFDNYKVADGTLQPGDIIALKYTTDLGSDIGAAFDDTQKSKKLKSLSILPVSVKGKVSSELDCLGGEFDPDVQKYEIAFRAQQEGMISDPWMGVSLLPMAENQQNRVRVFVGEKEYRGKYNIPITEKETTITIKVEAVQDGVEDLAPMIYTIVVHKDPSLLGDGDVIVTETASDGHPNTPKVYFYEYGYEPSGGAGTGELSASYTADLQVESGIEAYEARDLTVSLKKVPEDVLAVLKYHDQEWNFENGTVTVKDGALFTGTRMYTIYLENRATGEKESYYLKLQKKPTRLTKYSFLPVGTGNVEYTEIFQGQLEGTFFQLDAGGKETGEIGFTPLITDYNVYLSGAIEAVTFDKYSVATAASSYAMRLKVNGEILYESEYSTNWAGFVAQAEEELPISLKEGINNISLEIFDLTNQKCTRTYTLHIIKKGMTAAELQEKILALPKTEDLSYSRDRKTVNRLKETYDKLSDADQKEISQEATEKLEAAVRRIEELYQDGITAIETLKNLIDSYSGKVTEANYKEYEEVVTESKRQYDALTDWIYEKFMSECIVQYNAMNSAVKAVQRGKIAANETIGQATDYIDDFMVSANAFNLTLGAAEDAYPVNFKDYVASNLRSGEACLPFNTPGRIKISIEDPSIFTIKSVMSTYIDKGLGGGNKPYENELYYMIPLKEGTTTFTVTLTDETGTYYGQTPRMIVHVNSDGEASIEKLAEKLTNINTLPYTTKYDTWYYWQGTEGAEFSFKVNGTGATVAVWSTDGKQKTEYPVDANGNVTVLLKDGYNPIEVSAVYEGSRVTQVYGMRGKALTYTLTNETRPGQPFKQGDQAILQFTGISTPVRKILRIYNPSTMQIWFDTDMPYQAQIISGGTQYTAGAITFTITGSGTINLSSGRLFERWWGEPLYSETAQGNTGEIAGQSEGFFSHIPDLTFTAEVNPDYKADIKVTPTLNGGNTVKPGQTVTMSLDELDLDEITKVYPIDTTNTFTKLQTAQTQFTTNIPGLSKVVSEEYTRKAATLKMLKTVTFTVPEDTPDGDYMIRGGLVYVMHGDANYGISPDYLFRLQIADVKITVQHDHVYGDWTITKEATCTEAGERQMVCSICGDVKSEAIAAKGHQYDAGQVTKASTCKEAGIRTYTCTVCHATLTEALPLSGHSYGSWTTTSEATVFAPERQGRTCSVCGTRETRTYGSALTPTIKTNAEKLPLKVKQKTTAFKVIGLANGDSVAAYTSSNTKVFTVSKNGTLTAGKKAGKATLTIRLASGLEKKIPVTVQKSTVTTTKITGLKSKVTLEKGKKLALKPILTPITSQQKFTYTSSNKKVATVNKSGVITAKKAGTAKITVKSGKKKFTVTVTVPKTKTTAINGVPSTVSVKKGKTYTLKAKLSPKGSEEKITYTSSNKKIATVSKTGKIKGVKKGTATITVKSGKASVKVQVTVR